VFGGHDRRHRVQLSIDKISAARNQTKQVARTPETAIRVGQVKRTRGNLNARREGTIAWKSNSPIYLTVSAIFLFTLAFSDFPEPQNVIVIL